MGRHRKLGDLALADGDFDAALESFRKPACDEAGKPFRGGLDHDRLMAIAFMRRDWPGFIDALRAAEFEPLDERQVIFSSSVALKYIRYDEDIGLRVNEIAEKYGGAAVRSRPRAAVKRKSKPA